MVRACNVIILLDVGELVSQALAVEVLLGLLRLVQHDLVWHLDRLVAVLFARGWVVVVQVALVKTVVVILVDQASYCAVQRVELLSVKSQIGRAHV